MSYLVKDVVFGDRSEWESFRTCSRSSGGPCARCGEQTFFGGHRRKTGSHRQVLGVNCFQAVFEPEKALKEKADREAAKAEDDDILADERKRRKEGRPPREGYTRRENYLVGPLENTNVGPLRRVYEVEGTLYDTEPYTTAPLGNETDQPTVFNFFKGFKTFADVDAQAVSGGEARLEGGVPYRARDKNSKHPGAVRTRENVRRKPPKKLGGPS